MTYTFRPQGVCSQQMEIDVEDGKVARLEVLGGCSGNLQGIAALSPPPARISWPVH